MNCVVQVSSAFQTAAIRCCLVMLRYPAMRYSAYSGAVAHALVRSRKALDQLVGNRERDRRIEPCPVGAGQLVEHRREERASSYVLALQPRRKQVGGRQP